MCNIIVLVYLFFFFKQKTAYEMRISDWSSDVCSSDLYKIADSRPGAPRPPEEPMFAKTAAFPLFATPVWGFDLPADRAAAVNAELLALLERWFTPRPALRPGETWQTTHRLHERAAFAPLLPFELGRASCRERVSQYV